MWSEPTCSEAEDASRAGIAGVGNCAARSGIAVNTDCNEQGMAGQHRVCTPAGAMCARGSLWESAVQERR